MCHYLTILSLISASIKRALKKNPYSIIGLVERFNELIYVKHLKKLTHKQTNQQMLVIIMLKFIKHYLIIFYISYSQLIPSLCQMRTLNPKRLSAVTT